MHLYFTIKWWQNKNNENMYVFRAINFVNKVAENAPTCTIL